MRRAIEVSPSGSWAPPDAAASVTLAFDDRHRRRIRMTDDSGEPFLLDLPETVVLADGDGLVLDEGGMIAVRAAAEPVADISCAGAAHAARLAWHIGNRHAPVQVLADGALRIRDDHVLVRMAEGLGARVRRHRSTFQPEPGAYAEGAAHGHAHAHDH